MRETFKKILKQKELPKSPSVDGGKRANKNILLCSGLYPPDEGGPATYTRILKEKLAADGFRIKVICYGEPAPGDETSDLYRISRRQNLLFRYFKYFQQVWRHSVWADLIYLQGPVSEGLPSYVACQLRSKPYILKVVGDFAWEQARQRHGVEELLDDFQDKTYSPKVELWRFVEMLVASKAVRVITPSEYLKGIVRQWGVPEERIEVIYNSVMLDDFWKSKEESRTELGLRGKVMVSASRLVPWKGFDTLITLMLDLKEEHPDLSLYIAGSGPDEEFLQTKINDLGLGARVKLLGVLDQKELWTYMKASDLFVLNTGYEGLSHLIIEAMGLGVPVLTTRVGGNPELIKDEENGLLFEYNNPEEIKTAIKKILNDQVKAEEYTVRSKEVIKKFKQENMLEQIRNLFRAL